jgi:hypothetical protein
MKSKMVKRIEFLAALVATVGTGIGFGGQATGAVGVMPPARAFSVAQTADSPAPVAVVTPVIQILETGGSDGLPEAYGLGVSGVTLTLSLLQPVPGSEEVTRTVIPALNDVVPVVGKLNQGTGAFFGAAQQAVAPLAVANPVLDAGVNAVSNQLDALSNQLGASIAPLNTTIPEVAATIRGLGEQ